MAALKYRSQVIRLTHNGPGRLHKKESTMKIGRFKFTGSDPREHIKEAYGFQGDLLDIFGANDGLMVHKWHHYIPIYDRYFANYRQSNVKFLEIGVSDGGSMQMWRKYFGDDATIFGIDINQRCAEFDGQAGQVRIGSQDDPAFLKDVVDEMGGVDVVLDDGSHVMSLTRQSLAILFPMLSAPGTYMIEDLHTAYWKRFGGGLNIPENFFADLPSIVDELHHWYHAKDPNEYAMFQEASGVHIHDSIMVIEKGAAIAPTHSRIGGLTD